MHLGINAIRFTRRFTGVGRYMECLLKEWSQMDIPFDKVTLYAHTPLKQEELAFPLERYHVEVAGRKVPDPLWEWWTLPSQAKNLDALFCPSFTIPFGYPGKCLVTYHGPTERTLGTYQWWRMHAYELLYWYSARKADQVCTVSHSVEKRLIEVFKIPPQKITVTYNAPHEAFRPIHDMDLLEQKKKQYIGGNNPFILFVGKLIPRHYIPNLLKAFARVKMSKRLPHLLLLVGPDNLNLNIPARAKKLGVGDSVVHIPYVVFKDLPLLYNAAEIFIYPSSETEGFGIPVIEAMACGTPVITVHCGGLRDFAPGAALMTQSSTVLELQDALEKMIFDSDLRKDLASKGLERSKAFTWRVTAEKTMEVLWKLAQGQSAG